tara:strand:- start:39 stop:590 length:552 start_codon:yes stop_codon:yes gene_type:complete
MFGMSMAEIAVILVLALVILGPEKLPDLARTLGKTIREIRRAGNQIRDAIMFEDEMRDYRKNNRSIARTNTPPSAGYVAKEYGDDMMDGPFDQLDDEEWGVGGSLTYDPNDYHHREQTRFDINMKSRGEVEWHASREVELETTDFSLPEDPGASSASLTNPHEVPHIDIREVHIHEQVEDHHS